MGARQAASSDAKEHGLTKINFLADGQRKSAAHKDFANTNKTRLLCRVKFVFDVTFDGLTMPITEFDNRYSTFLDMLFTMIQVELFSIKCLFVIKNYNKFISRINMERIPTIPTKQQTLPPSDASTPSTSGTERKVLYSEEEDKEVAVERTRILKIDSKISHLKVIKSMHV